MGFSLFSFSVVLIAIMHTCFCAQNKTTLCLEPERLALLKFKHSVKDESRMLSSWVGNECCQWKGVHCDVATRRVVSLSLMGNNLDTEASYLVGDMVDSSLGKKSFSGLIPPHIGNLSNLEVLDLSASYIDLVIYDIEWVFRLSLLKHLDLSRVDLSTSQNIDKVMYMIPSLVTLKLSRCKLSVFELRASLNSSKALRNIQHLDLSYNWFDANIPVFLQNMSSLTYLDLSEFDFSLATLWVANLTNLIPSLSELHLSNCALSGEDLFPIHYNFSTHFHIHHLDLSSNHIVGNFPHVLTNMSSLRVLNLYDNYLDSSVPIMPNLVKLDISHNIIKKIEHVGLWRQCHLQHLSVSSNDLGQELIHSSMNVSECSQYALEILYLDQNQLKGSIPESIERLTNLRLLDLSRNSLTDLPKALERLRSLQVIDVSSNQLNGTIPAFLPRHAALQVFSAHSNLLNGEIPISVGQLGKINFLDVSRNYLEGVVFETHFSKLTMLKYLDISSNGNITFNVSREWIPPFQLRTGQLGSCKIVGEFPQWVQTQRKLKKLVLSNTTISGPLPEWLSKVPFISILDLSYNNLSGRLENLPLRNPFNNLGYEYTGSLRLQSNLFSGTIPRSFCQRKDLKDLDLSRNMLIGKIPNCLGNLTNLQDLDISRNRLTGNIPNGLGNLSNLEDLDLSRNKLTGKIPNSLRDLTLLKDFDLSRNRLSGNVPSFLEDLIDLDSIILSSNKFSGVIPNFGRILELTQLHLNDNNLTGELPQDIGSLPGLLVLDVGNNKFSGKMPEWDTPLIVLRLHRNNFTGDIPHSLCKSSCLKILDVAHNNLKGLIPHCFGELLGMKEDYPRYCMLKYNISRDVVIQVMKGIELEYTTTLPLVVNMDLSSNELGGQIPKELTTLTQLLGLNLSHNHLTGSIPSNIGNMKSLFSLDFSQNKLNGIIPSSMSDLNFLSYLNLSHNNLSGPIPTGNQLQTLNDPSTYAANKYLCGAPLPKNCSDHEDPTTKIKKNLHEGADEPKKLWFYLDIMSGFATGFWGVVGVLFFKKRWRHNLFRFVEANMDKIHVVVAIRVAKMKRRK